MTLKRIVLILIVLLILPTFSGMANPHRQSHDHDTSVIHSSNGKDHHHNYFEQFMPEGHEHGSGVGGTLLTVFKHTMMVTVFVLVMMLLLEYITVLTGGKWNRFLGQRNWLQIIVAAILGALPGCMGTYVAVSLYAHRMFSFAALVTAMISTSGDEAFIMLGLMPGKALLIFALLAAIAIVTGIILHVFMKEKTLMPAVNGHFKVHESDPHCICFQKELLIPQLKKITFERALLIFGGAVFLTLLLAGELGLVSWTWMKITFVASTIVGLAIIITVPNHFLKTHLWGHIIKKHFHKIFLWTFGAFLVIHLIIPMLNIEEWLEANTIIILMIALLVGIIPESGPHIVFITLYISGTIPLSVLVANSIVQDGHGALPLLAESRRSFIAMKLVSMIIGLIVGLSGIIFGW